MQDGMLRWTMAFRTQLLWETGSLVLGARSPAGFPVQPRALPVGDDSGGVPQDLFSPEC